MNDTVTPDIIYRHANGIFAPLAMLAGMKLDIFSALRDRGRSATEITQALALEATPERTALLLNALVAAGLLEKSDNRYANTPEAQKFLVKGRDTYMGGLANLYGELWPAGFLSAETLQTGVPQAAHPYHTMTENELETYYSASFPGALKAGAQLAEMADFSDISNVLDVGGGSGGLSIGLARAIAGLTACVFDFPGTTLFTERFIAGEAAGDRVSARSGDITQDVPGGMFDCAVFRNVLQVLSPGDAARAVRHAGQAVKPGGRILVWGWAIGDNGLEPEAAALHNLVFLNFYDHGAAHPESAYRQWLGDAGFAEITLRVLPGGFSLIEGVRAS